MLCEKNDLITRSEVIKHLNQIYGCIDDGLEHSRGNQYRVKIEKMVDEIFDTVEMGNYTSNIQSYITNILPWHVMNSLRDTDEGLTVELR